VSGDMAQPFIKLFCPWASKAWTHLRT
jgi:hypothetical protein